MSYLELLVLHQDEWRRGQVALWHPDASASERAEHPFCYEGWEFLGYEGVGEDGEHLEVIECVPCRRCRPESR